MLGLKVWTLCILNMPEIDPDILHLENSMFYEEWAWSNLGLKEWHKDICNDRSMELMA